MNGRALVMERIRKAAAKAAAGPLADARERPQFPHIAARSPFVPGMTSADCAQRFRTELEALASWVYGPLDAEGVADTVVRLVQERHASRVLAWDEAEIDCPPVAGKLREAGIQLVRGEVPNDEEHQATLERLAQIEVGLTGAIAGLVDTGSIVVSSGPGRPRNASLLPLYHVAILSVSRFYRTMQDWLEAGGVEQVKESANLVVITGGSRTSDIELQLTLGMHGPRELHVVLYQD